MTADLARAALKLRLDTLVAELVAMATPDWPVSADHCFLRIAYDNAVDDQWDRICRGPAWRKLPIEHLAAAVTILDRIANGGRPVLVPLNEASLDHRRRRRQALKHDR